MSKILLEINSKEKEIEIKGKSIRVDKLMELINIYPETAVAVKDGELLCDDDKIKDGERIKIVVATSKG
ncbi:thiamine biosynthesis protein ThiS [Desulfurobacterium thermolithotrophum]|uniref:MoaD/ThiS family protein n=1 Tax=Desulfurobacterium thermolithotrophum TaxID=64160 RepID=UPI0013D2CA35|nr:MoaD/ThiS family protein [Desulfurobacterium thermolithotrophum]